MKQKFMNFAILALLSSFTLAASVPNTFTANTPAVASQVNANFASLVAAVTSLESRVAVLEGQLTMADVAGTYAFENLIVTTSKGNSGNTGTIDKSTAGGTVTLNANGTFSVSIFHDNSRLRLDLTTPSTPTITSSTSTNPDGGSGNWTISGNTLTLGSNTTFIHAAGGRLFINAFSDFSDPEFLKHEIDMLIRTD